ncbi:MAG: TIGR02099 family protein [Thioalkalivibrio sp.]|nr:MAG: TIGR02099 family protein [Thioalkalivibrio sp.]
MRRSLRHGLAALAVVLVLLVLLLLALRLLLPHWAGLTTQVEQRVGALIDREVQLEQLQLGWSGWVPELVARDVRILGADTAPLLASELGVSLDPVRSLRARAPVLRKARLAGVDLHVTREADGSWDVHGWGFGGDRSMAIDWRRHFAGMERLEISDGSLQWEDALTGVQTTLFVDRVGLRADAAGLRLAGTGSLLPEAGGPVYVGIVIPPAGPDRIDFYLEADDLQLPYWTRATGWLEQGPAGTSSVRLWADLEDGRVRRLQGEHRTRLIHAARVSPQVDELGHRFQWRRRGAVSESHWSATTPGAGDLRLEYHISPPGRSADRITVAATGLDLRRLARPAAGLRLPGIRELEHLAALDPVGQLDSLYLDLEQGDEGWRVNVADALLRGLAVDAVDAMPAFSGLDVSLHWRGGRGDLVLDSSGLGLAMPSLFADPLWADGLHARVGVERLPGGWAMDIEDFRLANADAAVEGRGRVELGAEPHLDLALGILRADGRQVARYLPVHKLPANTYRWLVESIRAATVTGGGMVLRGNPADFPFEDGEGLFHLRASIEEGLLDYRPGWPEARDLSGTLVFHNAAFRAEKAAGTMLDSEIGDTEVTIANMLREPELEIRGLARGSPDDLRAYLERAGIAGGFGPVVAGVQAEGASELDLSLKIPLYREAAEPVRVSGRVSLREAGLELPESGIRLAGIDGEVDFDPVAGIRGEGITAQVHGERVTLDLQRDAAGDRTLIRARGPQPLAPWIGEPHALLESVRGMATWEADIVIDAAGDSWLKLSSDLEGVQLDWPAPLAKTTGTRRPIRIVWPLGQPGEAMGRIDFDDVLAVQARVAPGQEFEPGTVRALALALGRPHPEVPLLPERGIDLHARLESPDADAWQRLAESLAPADPPVGTADGLRLRQAEIEVQDGLRWRGQFLPGLRARLRPTAYGRHLDLHSEWLQGQAWSARPESSDDPAQTGRWYVNLERLHLDHWAEQPDPGGRGPGSGPVSGPADPRGWPAVEMRVDDLRLGQLQLAGLEIDLQPVAEGLEVSRLRAASPRPGVALEGEGHWLVMPHGGAESRIEAELSGSDWGEGLGSMGISAALEQGEGSGRLQLSWPGALYAPELATLQGRVEIDVQDGQLREVDPGAGRLLGLVSLDLVPRRLRLDFRDVYTQGLAFDRMAGEAVLDGGDLLLPELRIQSPSAVVRVSGRTGLVARDFEQSIVVVPRLRSTLPIVGTLLGGPVTGVVVLVVERALGIGDQVEEAARVEYFVTGPWSDPDVTARVRAEQGSAE